MQMCTTHWIQFRDKYEHDDTLFAANILSQQALLDSEILRKLFSGDIYKMQDQVHSENGCPACFHKKYTGEDIFPVIDKLLSEMPKEKLEMFKSLHRKLVDANKDKGG